MYTAFDRSILAAVERARQQAEVSLRSSPRCLPEMELEKWLKHDFFLLNSSSATQYSDSGHLLVQGVQLKRSFASDEAIITKSTSKMAIGGLLVGLGQPILRKRFVMQGAATGTSIASKYLARALPFKMPMRILGTNILGRAIGRAVPYIGWALLIIDVVELLIEDLAPASPNSDERFQGFGGGSFGGGGAGGSW